MNRRSFLAALGLAPVVVPLVAKASEPEELPFPIYVFREGPCGECQLGGSRPPGPWVNDGRNTYRRPPGYVYGHAHGEISTAAATLTETPFGTGWFVSVS